MTRHVRASGASDSLGQLRWSIPCADQSDRVHHADIEE